MAVLMSIALFCKYFVRRSVVQDTTSIRYRNVNFLAAISDRSMILFQEDSSDQCISDI